MKERVGSNGNSNMQKNFLLVFGLKFSWKVIHMMKNQSVYGWDKLSQITKQIPLFTWWI